MGSPPIAAARALAAWLTIAAVSATEASASDPGSEPEEVLDPRRYELAVLPILAGSTDIGLGVGAIGAVAKFEPGYLPYRWRLQGQLFASGKEAPGGGVELPHHDDSIEVDLPELLPRIRLTLRGTFAKDDTLGYYGLGNASRDDRPWERFDPDTEHDAWVRAKRYNQYQRLYPSVSGRVRVTIWPGVFAFAGASMSYSRSDIYPGSKLEEDLAGRSGSYVRSKLFGLSTHGLLAGDVGAAWDTRDHETAPSRGMLHEISLRGGRGLGEPFAFGGFHLAAHFYFSIWRRYLVVATRLATDILFEDPPVYELSRMGGLAPFDAPGGGSAVRGVPAGRYAGRLKTLGNLELRTEALALRILEQRLKLGTAAFFDSGRARWTLQPHPELDGTSPAPKIGVGGGPRVRWGETFVVRFDAAWSPDGVGFYVNANQAF